ncbi:MAG: SpoIIE family protein phosphatase, partial [Oscillospiraceae bacterium]|nr:SpoIIE family protein phosphatase [Oscillospiraceae bacterium]
MLLRFKKLIRNEWIQAPIFCIGAVFGGYFLSIGTISGIVSPLAIALAGICSPLYAFCMLLGSLVAYTIQQAPEGMQFLLTALVSITCMRILFYDTHKPHVMGILTAISCFIAGILLDLIFRNGEGKLPLYILESFLTGTASFFLADAMQSIRENKNISLDAGKSFTFAICYLLGITALCGIDLEFCNLGRITGMILTLLVARQFKQSAGTLCGALTTCGIVLCSVPLGMPLLFLPVTAMLAGFLCKLPNAVLIPAFFFMQILSSAVLDSSIELVKILVELMIACCIYAMCSKIELRYIIALPTESPAGQRQIIQQEQFLSDALQELREETSAVMRHLTVNPIFQPIPQVKENICQTCKNYATCWKLHAEQTEKAFQQLLHTPSISVEILENCINLKKLTETMSVYSQRRALQQMQKVQLLQNRAMTLEYLQLLEHLTADSAKRRTLKFCEAETVSLKNMLNRCAITESTCFVYKLKSSRYAVEIYTKQEEFPLATIQELLNRQFHVNFKFLSLQQKNTYRHCYYQIPPYQLDSAIKSLNAPAYERCGDHADSFTDAVGNQYLVISDGMGSGSTASLASRIAVKTFKNMVTCEMSPESAIRLVNTMLMSETNTENFATLDILMLHADTGELTLYKSGAVATLFYHENKIQTISSKSFPVGIVPNA